MTYEMNNGQTMTTVKSKAAARRLINEALNPCVVKVTRGDAEGYDAYPSGWPIPRQRLGDGTRLEIIERCALRARGHKWVAV
jgi:hypothetical protein